MGICIANSLHAQNLHSKTDSTQITIIDTSGHSITDNDTAYTTSVYPSNSENKVHSNVQGQEEEHHGGMESLFFIIVAVVIGAATRHFFRKIPLPFTVLLLLFGIGLGLLNRFGLFEDWGETISLSIEWAAHIDPHAILFILRLLLQWIYILLKKQRLIL